MLFQLDSTKGYRYRGEKKECWSPSPHPLKNSKNIVKLIIFMEKYTLVHLRAPVAPSSFRCPWYCRFETVGLWWYNICLLIGKLLWSVQFLMRINELMKGTSNSKHFFFWIMVLHCSIHDDRNIESTFVIDCISVVITSSAVTIMCLTPIIGKYVIFVWSWWLWNCYAVAVIPACWRMKTDISWHIYLVS